MSPTSADRIPCPTAWRRGSPPNREKICWYGKLIENSEPFSPQNAHQWSSKMGGLAIRNSTCVWRRQWSECQGTNARLSASGQRTNSGTGRGPSPKLNFYPPPSEPQSNLNLKKLGSVVPGNVATPPSGQNCDDGCGLAALCRTLCLEITKPRGRGLICDCRATTIRRRYSCPLPIIGEVHPTCNVVVRAGCCTIRTTLGVVAIVDSLLLCGSLFGHSGLEICAGGQR